MLALNAPPMTDNERELPAEALRCDRQEDILVREAAEAERGEDSRDRPGSGMRYDADECCTQRFDSAAKPVPGSYEEWRPKSGSRQGDQDGKDSRGGHGIPLIAQRGSHQRDCGRSCAD